MTERSPTGSDTLRLEEAAEAGSQLFQGCSEEGTTPTEEIAEQRNILKAPFMSKEKEKTEQVLRALWVILVVDLQSQIILLIPQTKKKGLSLRGIVE